MGSSEEPLSAFKILKFKSLFCHVCLSLLILQNVLVSGLNTTDYGRQMVVRIHQGICWYEYLKFFPKTNSREFLNCQIQAPSVLRQINEQSLDNKYFGDWMLQLAMVHLPKQYKNCDTFLLNSNKSPSSPTNYSDIDFESAEKPYPFRGFVHCILDELHARHGEQAISHLKAKITRPEHWKLVILDRENEFRHRHSSRSLKLAKLLSQQAQKWANKIAQECNPRHSKGTDPDRQFTQGNSSRSSGNTRTGESLAMSSAPTVPVEDISLMAINGWYEEIKDYPFPEGYQGNGSDALFPKIGHFTQTVWKGSQFVGYGYASNRNCSSFKTYVVARYFPAGNVIGNFAENVLKPK